MFYSEITSISLLSQFLSLHINTRADITIPNQVLLRFFLYKLASKWENLNQSLVFNENNKQCGDLHAEIIGNDRRIYFYFHYAQ